MISRSAGIIGLQSVGINLLLVVSASTALSVNYVQLIEIACNYWQLRKVRGY